MRASPVCSSKIGLHDILPEISRGGGPLNEDSMVEGF